MNRVSVGYFLNKELKNEFKKKIISDVSYVSMNEAFNDLVQKYVKNYTTSLSMSSEKIFTGFVIDTNLKKLIKNTVENSYEFSSATDLVNKVIYEYVIDDETV